MHMNGYIYTIPKGFTDTDPDIYWNFINARAPRPRLFEGTTHRFQ